MNKVILTSESACDLGEEHLTRLGVPTIPYHIHLDGSDYLDGIDLTAEDIFRVYREKHVLPQTGADRMPNRLMTAIAVPTCVPESPRSARYAATKLVAADPK